LNKKVHITLCIFFVYLVSVSIRLLQAWQTYDSDLHTLDGQFLSILTHDAALYGHYASLLLAGIPRTTDVYLIEYLIFYLVKLTPFTLDQIIYFTPAFLSTLIVIPTMLIALLYIHSKFIVIFTGIISSIGYGYYSRTYLGYLDTDILNLFFPMFMLYGMLSIIRKKSPLYFIIILMSIVLYLTWYQSSRPLIYAMTGIFFFYLLVYYAYTYREKLFQQRYYVLGFLFMLLVGAIHLMEFTPIERHINRYLLEREILHISNFNFVSPMQHVSEAKSTNFSFIVHLISGNMFIFLLSLLGYVLLIYRHKEIILTLPMVLLGLLSLYAGVRFHIYAIFIFILSYFYLLYALLLYKRVSKNIILLGIIFLTIPPLYENYKNVTYWNTRGAVPIFYPEQVAALKELEKDVSSNDYAVTWWDYGYAVQYYTGLNTMIDNGRHRADSYTVASLLLTSSQEFTHHAIHYFYTLFDTYKRNAIVHGLNKHKSTKDLFAHIEQNPYSKKSEITKYIILPAQLGKILYTMYMYANIDPYTGDKVSNHIFKMFTKIGEDNRFIYLNDTSKIEKKSSTFFTKNRKLTIKRVNHVRYKNKQKKISQRTLTTKGLNLIIHEDKYYIMDDYFYQSSVVQMMFLNRYNKKYFTAVHIGKNISIFKVN